MNKSVFEYLENLTEKIEDVSRQVSTEKVSDEPSQDIKQLSEKVDALSRQIAAQNTPPQAEENKQNVLVAQSLFAAKKFVYSLHTRKQFSTHRICAVALTAVAAVLGIAAAVQSTLCQKLFTTFTFGELFMIYAMVWMGVYSARAKFLYEMQSWQTYSPMKYDEMPYGCVACLNHLKGRYVAAISVGVVCAACNILCIAVGDKTIIVSKLISSAVTLEIIFSVFCVAAAITVKRLFFWYGPVLFKGILEGTKYQIVSFGGEFLQRQEFEKRFSVFDGTTRSD